MKLIKITALAALAALGFTGTALAQGSTTPMPERPVFQRPELPQELKDQIAAYRTEQAALRTELKAAIEALGAEATREEIKAAVEAFRTANAERIAEQRELGADIREQIKTIVGENRPNRPFRPALDALRRQFMASRMLVMQKQRELAVALRAATTAEERQALIAAYREEVRQYLQTVRDARRELRGGEGTAPGERRPGG